MIENLKTILNEMTKLGMIGQLEMEKVYEI